jgi:hypothetical protein
MDNLDSLDNKGIADRVGRDFSTIYAHFREFQRDPAHRAYWDKCMGTVLDGDLLMNIVFCNDVFGIPPVRTFLTYYRDDFILLTGRADARLDTFVKRGIGAFWGMVFKFALRYAWQRSVSVPMGECFMVKTASAYGGRGQRELGRRGQGEQA